MDLNIIRINHDDGQWKETIDTGNVDARPLVSQKSDGNHASL